MECGGLYIMGMHRSGTSLLTMLLEKCGFYVGDSDGMLTPSEWNPKGFWERQDVMLLNERLLDLLRPDCADWPAMQSWMKIPCKTQPFPNELLLRDWRRERDRILLEMRECDRPWVIKDPRLSLTHAYWTKGMPPRPAVVMFREPMMVANSLARRNAIPEEAALGLWEAYMVSALRYRPLELRIPLSLDDLVREPVTVLRDLLTRLSDMGIEIPVHADPVKAAEALEPSLLSNAAAKFEAEDLLGQGGRALVEKLRTGRACAAAPSDLSSLAALRIRAMEQSEQSRIAAHFERETINRERDALADNLRRALEEQRELHRLINEQAAIHDVLVQSLRWRVGDTLGKAADKLLRRSLPSPLEAEKNVRKHIHERPRPPVLPVPSNRNVRVIGLLNVFNEARYLPTFLDHMASQKIEVYLIDHQSTDHTRELAEERLGRSVVGIETFQRKEKIDYIAMLRRKEELAQELDADWFVNVDPDEFRLPPAGRGTLQDWFTRLDRAGWNAVNFQEYTFIPWAEEPAHSPETFLQTMRWYYPFLPASPHRLNAWKKQDRPVDLVQDCGHIVRFDGICPYPESFIMRHYPVLSFEHACEKYGGRVYPNIEMKRGWHGWRHGFSSDFLRLPSYREMRFYVSDQQLDSSEPLKKHLFINDR